MNKLFLLGCISVLLAFQTVQAQTNFDPDSYRELSISLSEVSVKAQQLKLYSELGRVLTVIDRKEIDALAVNSIDALLENMPGIDIRQRGTNGTQADISMRGGTFDQVLVLLNGVNITDPQTGHYNLDIPVELTDIVKVEILQGSSARLLGPNAFSGAINIVTEKTEKASLQAHLSGGSYNSFSQGVSAGLGNNKLQSFLSFNNKSSDGYIKNTDYQMLNAFSHTVLRTKNAGKFNLQMAYQQKAYGADGFYHATLRNQFEDTKTIFSSMNWTKSLKNFRFEGQAYWRRHHDRFEFFRDFENAASWYTSHYYHLTDVAGAKFNASWLSRVGKLTLGVETRNEHIYSTTLGKTMDNPKIDIFEDSISFTKSDNRLLNTAYFDYSKNLGKFYLSAGMATTMNHQFGTYSYGGVDLGYSLNENTRIYVSANSAVRLPTFTDLYYTTSTHQGNVDLKPETSKTLELGAKFSNRGLNINVSSFYRKAENVIDWVKYTAAPKFESRNLTLINAFGGEITANYSFEKGFIHKISGSYSYLNLDKIASADYDSQYALDYLKHKAVLGLQHKVVDNLSVNWNLSYNDRAGNYFDTVSDGLVDYQSFFMLDTRFNYRRLKYELYCDINNILNSVYVDYGGLPQPGINFKLGIKMKI